MRATHALSIFFNNIYVYQIIKSPLSEPDNKTKKKPRWKNKKHHWMQVREILIFIVM